MHPSLALIAFFAYGIAAIRVLSHRPSACGRERRYRRHHAWMTWAVIVVLGASSIHSVMHWDVIGVLEVGQATLLSLLVVAARGDLSRLFSRT
jgi:hypothetical protein